MKSYRDIACRSCSAVILMEISNSPTEMKKVWYPGKKCPMCGSQEFYPSIVDETAPVRSPEKKGWRYNPWYGIGALVIVIVVAPLILLAIHLARRQKPPPPRTVVLVCAECQEIFEKEISKGAPPYECLKCKAKAAYQALYCKRDWTIFPWKSERGGNNTFPRCPECGEVMPDSPALLTSMSDVAKCRANRKKYDEWKKLIEEQENARK